MSYGQFEQALFNFIVKLQISMTKFNERVKKVLIHLDSTLNTEHDSQLLFICILNSIKLFFFLYLRLINFILFVKKKTKK
jgi:hypothetical protein